MGLTWPQQGLPGERGAAVVQLHGSAQGRQRLDRLALVRRLAMGHWLRLKTRSWGVGTLCKHFQVQPGV